MISLLLKVLIFLKKTGILYDLLIYLFGNSKRLLISKETLINLTKAIKALKIINSNAKSDITDQSEKQKEKTFAEQESVLNDAEVLLEKRNNLINKFTKNNIIPKDEKLFDAPKKIEKSTPEESFFEQIEVSRDKLDSKKLKILRNKKLGTMVDKKQYTLSDINILV